jgi:hypothetical protein
VILFGESNEPFEENLKKGKKTEKPLSALQGSNFQVLFHGLTTAGILSFSNYRVQ